MPCGFDSPAYGERSEVNESKVVNEVQWRGFVALAQEVREDDGRWFADEQKGLKFT